MDFRTDGDTFCLVTFPLLALLAQTVYGNADATPPSVYNVDIGLRPSVPGSIMCTAVKLSHENQYIVSFTPYVEQHLGEHMVVYGCRSPASDNKIWTCDEDGMPEHEVCDGEKHVLFAWGKNAPVYKIPKGAGFQVGGSTNIHHIVVQIEFSRGIPEQLPIPKNGAILGMTRARPSFLMDVFEIMFPNKGHTLNLGDHADSGCKYNGDSNLQTVSVKITVKRSQDMLGTVYRVRDNKYSLIGKVASERPQAFYPSRPQVDVQRGDYLVARCTALNDWPQTTDALIDQKVCSIYVAYYTDYQDDGDDDELPFPCVFSSGGGPQFPDETTQDWLTA